MSEHEDQLVGAFPFVPKQERAQQKRNALLESGRKLFILHGYELTTAKEIAAEAGVATGTFYRYFSDKRQLLMSLIEDKLDLFLPLEPNWIAQDPVAVLASHLEAHAQYLYEWGFHRVLPELLPKDPELSEALNAARKKIHLQILSSLKQACEKGLTWKDLDLDMVTWSIMVLVENLHGKVVQGVNQVNYLEMAKVICRLVFPPEKLAVLTSNTGKEE